MAKKKSKDKVQKGSFKKPVTPAAIIGLLMGGGMIGGGIYSSVVHDSPIGYYAAALGIVFSGLVLMIHHSH